jgi:hypothetical protein
MMQRNCSCISTLAFLGKITPFRNDLKDQVSLPDGCMVVPATADIVFHIPLDGLLDVAAEVVKTEKKLAALQKSFDALEKVTQAPNYANAKEEVKSAHKEKLQVTMAEIQTNQAAIASFMKIVNLKSYYSLKTADLKAEIGRVEKDKLKYTPKPKPGEEDKPMSEKTKAQLEEFDLQKVALESQIKALSEKLAAL